MYILTIEKPPEGAPIRLPKEGIAAVYRERLAQFGGPIAEHRELIVDDEAVVYRPVDTVLLPRPWYRGRVVLLGDAAHATSPHCGQGAAQAIEDGIVLTQELDNHDDLQVALAAWEERRYDRCRMVKEGSEAIGKWEIDHSQPIDPVAKRQEVTEAAMAPF
jgi:2-polyprenyl-6-methoxyphenol hydroxylase-like FAD-dependent oxidoreductase